jgi:hypothetical protein
MSAPTSSAADEKVLPVAADMEAELTELLNQKMLNAPEIESDAGRIRSSVARLTSTSIDGLEGLASELQELQRFLNSEVRRVQSEIESALAGMKIIIETIAPWKSCGAPIAPPASTQSVAMPRAATIQGPQSRR